MLQRAAVSCGGECRAWQGEGRRPSTRQGKKTCDVEGGIGSESCQERWRKEGVRPVRPVQLPTQDGPGGVEGDDRV
eukprot:CAMPEP_0172556830 /NCGR_PEP_ID=MMETSP1067-20121228/69294_1 /TAXON_ID=265564 ORGANISM="Thalassiosira punctigera, Strain Tpunct2005C2" /NCGR_SAMPLE_ID=MMETSP1067 /ASSEMBLY_ACC=CAM_ASM_000444 /LENGTH=75 /DNA_ID=CAMNT_0013345735 /DNA_START=100 /DNA_END=323 /DNA_ORIENTATION=-